MPNPTSSWLATDHYQLTMANGYFASGMHETPAIFEMFFRRNPFGGHFTVAAGLDTLIEHLSDLRFGDEELRYLSESGMFSSGFLDYLAGLRLTCNIEAVPEGTVVQPMAPLVKVGGPLLQCQLLETVILTTINFQTLIATKAARCVLAAEGKPVYDFGMRRAHGVEASVLAARAAYLAGCAGTSNELAGLRWGIPTAGTMAHSWVMSHASEQGAFDNYAFIYPQRCILLVDTYDARRGIERAVATKIKYGLVGGGIRLDAERSQLPELACFARTAMNDAGWTDGVILASSDLDETSIAAMRDLPIDGWGVGTRLVTGAPDAALGGVYKLVEIDGHPRCKTHASAPGKGTLPGAHRLTRHVGTIIYDTIRMASETPLNSEHDLLVPVFSRGELCCSRPTLSGIREYTALQLSLEQSATAHYCTASPQVEEMKRSMPHA